MLSGIESVAAIQSICSSGETCAPSTLQQAPGTLPTATFADIVQRGIGGLNESVGAAERAMTDMASGRSVELHEVMISLERARISVQTFVQVRNKLIESYQDLMRMQL